MVLPQGLIHTSLRWYKWRTGQFLLRHNGKIKREISVPSEAKGGRAAAALSTLLPAACSDLWCS